MIPAILRSLRAAVRQPGFVVVAIILLLAAVGLNATTEFMQLHFRKLAVPLNKDLGQFPETLGPWRQVSIDAPLSHDIQDALATDKYVMRTYVDSRLVSPAELARFKDLSPGDRQRLAAELRQKKPQAVVDLSLTYYTGLVDTVAHVPDRCFTADGYEPTRYTVEPWSALKDRRGDHLARFIVFEDQSDGRTQVAQNVAYFFNCNGEYMNDPIGVRRRLASLRERHGYYMKIETHVPLLSPPEAARVMDDLLKYALPEVEKCLPDWDKFTATQSGPASVSR